MKKRCRVGGGIINHNINEEKPYLGIAEFTSDPKIC